MGRPFKDNKMIIFIPLLNKCLTFFKLKEYSCWNNNKKQGSQASNIRLDAAEITNPRHCWGVQSCRFKPSLAGEDLGEKENPCFIPLIPTFSH
jgi:hypothetical protein